jgi:hypothetical protein
VGTRTSAAAIAASTLACGATDRGAPDPAALAVIGFADGARIQVLALGPEPATPGDPIAMTMRVEADVPLALEVASWPPRVGGRELVIGSGVDRDDAARLDDPRVSRVAIAEARGDVEVEVPLQSPWHPRTAMITIARQDGVVADSGPRTRDGLGSAGVVGVAAVPLVVVAARASGAIVVDGALDEAAWSAATPVLLGDSLDGEPAAIASEVRFLWDDEAVYVGATMDDDDVWTQFDAQDDPLWKEEAFELFFFGDASRKRYLELQVSPRGVTFDARFDQYRKGDEAWDGPWQGAAIVDGTVDVRDDRDRGWVVEMAVPLSMICEHTAMQCPPVVGTTTRINAFRLDRPKKAQGARAFSLAPTRVPDFHAPDNAAMLELGG